MPTDDKTYNGWTNYETWAVALWIDNEQSTHEQARLMTAETRAKSRVCGNDHAAAPYSLCTRCGALIGNDGAMIGTTDDLAARLLSDALKEWVTDELLPDLGATLAADLLGAAVSEVNWREIALNYLSEEG